MGGVAKQVAGALELVECPEQDLIIRDVGGMGIVAAGEASLPGGAGGARPVDAATGGGESIMLKGVH